MKIMQLPLDVQDGSYKKTCRRSDKRSIIRHINRQLGKTLALIPLRFNLAKKNRSTMAAVFI
jgi:hypothetical protein